MLGGKDRNEVLKENILYREGEAGKSGKRLDIYLPIRRKSRKETMTGDDSSLDGIEREPLRPVVIFLGGANWSFWSKSLGSLIALRLRSMGYVVVVPNLTNWPEGNCKDSVEDFRFAAEYTASRCSSYGGNPDQIFVMGFGSGCHIGLLTIVQEAVVQSRDEYLYKISAYVFLVFGTFPFFFH